MDMNLVKQYAEFAVKIGVNPQPGQTLIIRAPIEGAFFARACAEAAYAAGAKEVVVHYSDEKLSRIKMEHTAVEVLEDVKPWLQRSYLDYVEIEDHGAGIAREDLPYIFDKYYRSRADAGKVGTGLGLSITKAILINHGFPFGVDSEPGKGSIFWFVAH